MEYEEIKIPLEAVKEPSEYAWYDDDRCRWVKKMDAAFRDIQKDCGAAALGADQLMGMVLLLMEKELRSWGFIPDSVSGKKLEDHIEKLLQSKNITGQNLVAEKLLWYTVEMLRQEFSLAVPHPGMFFAALFHLEGANQYMKFFKQYSVDMESAFNTCADLFEGPQEDSAQENDSPAQEVPVSCVDHDNGSDQKLSISSPARMLSEILKQANLNPERCKLVRHSSTNTKLKKCLSDPGWFEAFQATQNRPVFDDCDYILIFLGESGTTARFVGCCQVNGRSDLNPEQMPAGFPCPEDFQLKDGIFYHLQWTCILQELWGKLIIDWGRSAVAWCQRAVNDKVVLDIEENAAGILQMTSGNNASQEMDPALAARIRRLLEQGDQVQALECFTDAYFNNVPDEELEEIAVAFGAEFQYMLARLYLQWDARRLDLEKAVKFAFMAAGNGRESAGKLYEVLTAQIARIKTS